MVIGGSGRASDSCARAVVTVVDNSKNKSVLAILNRKGATSISQLAEIQGLERTSMSRTLTTMEKSDLIALSKEGWRRTREATITDLGREKLLSALPLWREAQDQFKAQFESEEINQLQEMLSRISDSADQEESA